MDAHLDYYTNRASKIGDFCLGFFGLCLLAIVAVAIGSANPAAAGWWAGVLTVFLIVAMGGTACFFRNGRRYIAIGMISAVVVPALLVGTCSIFIFGAGGFH